MEYAVGAWSILCGILLILLYGLRHRPAAAKIIGVLNLITPSFDPRILLLSGSLGIGIGLALFAHSALGSDDLVIFLVASLAVSIGLFLFLVRSFGIVFSMTISQKQKKSVKILLVSFAVWLILGVLWALFGV